MTFCVSRPAFISFFPFFVGLNMENTSFGILEV